MPEKLIDFAFIELAKERYSVCKECEFLNATLTVCGKCNCFLPIKVIVPTQYCPINKWSKANHD